MSFEKSKSPLANYIKKRRNELNLTQKQLAMKACLSEVEIKKYENNERTPKVQQLIKLSKALDVSTNELILLWQT